MLQSEIDDPLMLRRKDKKMKSRVLSISILTVAMLACGDEVPTQSDTSSTEDVASGDASAMDAGQNDTGSADQGSDATLGDTETLDTTSDTTTGDVDTNDATTTGGVRFAIEVSNDVSESIWAQLNDAEGQPGWIRVRRGETRVWLLENCGVPECENSSGVCGMALPQVRDFTDGSSSGEIEFVWDGEWSVFDDEAMCERREPAPAGDYVATFCFSLNAQIDEGQDGDPARQVAGTLIDPVCVDQAFTLPTDEVVHGIWGG